MSKRIFLTLFISLFILLILSITAGIWVLVKPKNDEINGSAFIGGTFILTDHNNQKITEKSFPRRFKILYFGYTFCPDICPTGMTIISEALDLLNDKAAHIKPLFITIDPKRDNVQVMAEYHRHFHPSFSNLTGTQDEIDHIAKLYKVYYKKSNPDEVKDYLLDHSSIMYILSAGGKYLTHFGPGATSAQIAAFFNREIQ